MCDLSNRYLDTQTWHKQTMLGYEQTKHDVHISNVNMTVKNSKIQKFKFEKININGYNGKISWLRVNIGCETGSG